MMITSYTVNLTGPLAAEHVKAAVEDTGGYKMASGPFSPIDYARAAAMSAEIAITLIKEPNGSYATAEATLPVRHAASLWPILLQLCHLLYY